MDRTWASRNKTFLLVIIGLAASLTMAVDIGLFQARLTWLGLIILIGLVVLRRFPEAPFVILVMGMPIWRLVPESTAPLIDGIAVPLTLSFACIGALLQRITPKDTAAGDERQLLDLDIWFVLFTLWLWIALLWSTGEDYGMFKALGFTAYSLTAYLVLRYGFRPQQLSLRRMAWLVLVAGLAHSVFTLNLSWVAGSWHPDHLDYSFVSGVTQRGLNFIDAADALTLGLLATSYLLINNKRLPRFPLIAAYAFQLWALMRYQQRGATIALLAGTVLIILFYNANRRIDKSLGSTVRLFLTAALVGLAGFGLLTLNPRAQLSHMMVDENVLTRLDFLRFGWGIFREQPLIGLGTGSSTSLLIPGLAIGIQRFYMHNRVFEIMVELGTVGLVLFCGVTMALFRRFFQVATNETNRKAWADVALLGGIIVARYVVGMTSGDLVSWNIGVWAGLLVAVYRQARLGNEERE